MTDFTPPPLDPKTIDTLDFYRKTYAHHDELRALAEPIVEAFEYLRRTYPKLTEKEQDYYMWAKTCHKKHRLLTGPTEQLLKFLCRRHLPGLKLWTDVNPKPENWRDDYRRKEFGRSIFD